MQTVPHDDRAAFKRHLDIDVSHGICPDCAARLYPEFTEQPAPEPHKP